MKKFLAKCVQWRNRVVMSSKEGDRQQPSSEGGQRLSFSEACWWNGEHFFYNLLLFAIVYFLA